LEIKRNWPGLAALVACALLTIGLGVAGLPLLKSIEAAVPTAATAPADQRAEK
jgi:hypothetical protein